MRGVPRGGKQPPAVGPHSDGGVHSRVPSVPPPRRPPLGSSAMPHSPRLYCRGARKPNAAQGVRASAEPAQSSAVRPDRAPPESRSTRAAVARSTGSTRVAAAARPGRALLAEGRWTPGRSLICIRAAAAAVEGLQAAVRAQLPVARSAHRVGYRCETCARYPSGTRVGPAFDPRHKRDSGSLAPLAAQQEGAEADPPIRPKTPPAGREPGWPHPDSVAPASGTAAPDPLRPDLP